VKNNTNYTTGRIVQGEGKISQEANEPGGESSIVPGESARGRINQRAKSQRANKPGSEAKRQRGKKPDTKFFIKLQDILSQQKLEFLRQPTAKLCDV